MSQPVTTHSFKKLYLVALFFFAAWLAIFWQGITTAISIWLGSEIFNHCLLVIPGAGYLAYRQRYQLFAVTFVPNFWVLPPILGFYCLYALGLAGDVQLFMHVAAFALLPLSVWFLIGSKAAKTVAFPLFFVLFSIPIGEELIPWLQQVTADISVYLLKMTGVPIFRSGLFIEVPKGRFLVAEACSGISFFIASIVIGSLYSHLNITVTWKKVTYIGLSVIFPILANALRVYGIILTAHLTDMEYAAGADHLIYGGVFFAIVIICLLFIGEFFRDKTPLQKVTEQSLTLTYGFISLKALMVNFFVMLGFALWFIFISLQNTVQGNQDLTWLYNPSHVSEINVETNDWKPIFQAPKLERLSYYTTDSGNPTQVYQAFYNAEGGELISSLNRLYSQDAWTIVRTEFLNIQLANNVSQRIYLELVSNPDGGKRVIASWFVLGAKTYADKRRAKLYQIFQVMRGYPVDGGVVAVSQEVSEDSEQQIELFLNDLASLAHSLNTAFPKE